VNSASPYNPNEQKTAIVYNMEFCVLCTRYFANNAALKQHQQDSPVHNKTFQCQSCGSKFASKAALKQHERDSPVHKKTFYCQDCDRPFRSNKTLENHKNLFHAVSGQTQDVVDTPLDQGRGRDGAMSTNTQPRAPIIDPQSALAVQFARMLVSAIPIPPAMTPNPQRARKHVPKQQQQPPQETREFFTFPELHPNVAAAVSPEISSTWFNGDHDDDDFDEEWNTHVMGRFKCTNNACKKPFWDSRKVPIEIRGYDNDGYSAVVYNQRCKSCNDLGTFELNIPSYVERVAYRLKKWAGVEMEAPPFNEMLGPPHERAYCEGCKRGKCREGDRIKLY
jgi:transcription elongation factor Elf1